MAKGHRTVVDESHGHQHYGDMRDREAQEILDGMEVDILEASSRKEESMVHAMESFASFVLYEEREACKQILEDHMGATVGALRGGNDQEEIYRVTINEDPHSACGELVRRFRTSSHVVD